VRCGHPRDDRRFTSWTLPSTRTRSPLHRLACGVDRMIGAYANELSRSGFAEASIEFLDRTGPLSGSLSESPMPIRSGVMQRPRVCRCSNTLRQRYEEVGLPCSSTIGSPSPNADLTVSGGGHYLQEDSPDEIGRAIADWMGAFGLTGAMKGYDGVASYSWLRRSRRRVDSGTLQGESAARVPGCFPLLPLIRAQR
jgi:hypothetical protein